MREGFREISSGWMMDGDVEPFIPRDTPHDVVAHMLEGKP